MSLSGWRYVLCVGTTGTDCSATSAAGVITIPIYATSTMTPAGMSYNAAYSPTKGSPRSETWVIPASATKLVEIKSESVPTPDLMIAPAQLTGGGATTGQCLTYNGTSWAPATCASGAGGLTWAELTGITWSQLQ